MKSSTGFDLGLFDVAAPARGGKPFTPVQGRRLAAMVYLV
jgi:hypothetical protein